jgi:hypothetical protein
VPALRRRPPAADPAPGVAPRPNAKGRATPKRSQARAQRGQSAPSTASGRAGRREAAAQRRERQTAYRQALLSTDPRQLPPAERLPEKVVARDVVDSRPSAGPLLLGALVLEVVGGFVKSHEVDLVLFYLLYAALLVAMIDSGIRVVQVRRAVSRQVPHPSARVGFYAVRRGLFPKRWRRPVPRG